MNVKMLPQFFNIKEYRKKNSWNFKFVCFFRLLFHWKFLQWEFWIIHLLHIQRIRANNTSACISCITVRWKHKYNFYIISDLFCSVMYTMCVYSTWWYFFSCFVSIINQQQQWWWLMMILPHSIRKIVVYI